jgi:hypothetical protein
VFGVGGDSGSSMSTTVVRLVLVVSLCKSWLDGHPPWCPISLLVTIQHDNFSRTAHIPACNGGKDKATRTNQSGMYSAVCIYILTPWLGRL